jgi:hypothetical protein
MDVGERSNWRDSVVGSGATVWTDDTAKNLLPLVESLEDEPCVHVPSDRLTEIGSGNNHRQQ